MEIQTILREEQADALAGKATLALWVSLVLILHVFSEHLVCAAVFKIM